MNKIPIIKRGYDGGMDFHESRNSQNSLLLVFFVILCGIFFIMLSMRLFQLTVVKGAYYRRLSEDNRLREVVIEAQRGMIIDRRGTVLVKSTAADLKQQGSRIFSHRDYEYPDEFAPIIGYRQAADKTDIKNDTCLNKIKTNYEFVDKVGKKGVEKLFECDLRGVDGKKLIEINAHGTTVRSLYVVPPEVGKTVQLSIDADLQQVAYDAIKGKRAAVIAMKPKTGEILVLASTPTFNPQAFEDNNNSLISHYFTDETKPLFNRATEGTYPPGSTFKPVLATGALEEKTITVDTHFVDNGFLMAGTLRFGNWEYLKTGRTDGSINVVSALKRSNDVYFYQLGQKMGPEKIKEWAEKFGFDQISHIGIDESSGSVPSPFWKEETLKEKWYTGDTYNFSIGQGYLLVTPLQVARETQVLANNGYICTPTLLKLDSESNKNLDLYQAEHCSKLPVSQSTLDTVKEGMVAACSPGGTGWPLFNFAVNDLSGLPSDISASPSAKMKFPQRKIDLACKTGTAETHEKSGIPFAWFTVYGPTQNPEIVVTVMIEEGGEGSDVAAPMAKEVLKKYFERAQ